MIVNGVTPTRQDAEWARSFVVLYQFLEGHPRSEDATLLLSTCRNAYLTINAQFADIQELLGGSDVSALRAGLELVDQGGSDAARVKKRFQDALAPIAQLDRKVSVWQDRHAINAGIAAQFDTYSAEHPLDSVVIRDIVFGTDVGPKNPEDGRFAELLRLDLAEQPHLQPYFEDLKRLRDLTEAVARFGMSYADSMPPPVKKQIDLLEDDAHVAAATEVREDRTVAYWARKISEHCGWTASGDETHLHVQVEPNYPRPAGAKPAGTITIARGGAAGTIKPADAVSLLREALWCAHGIATSKFKPNVLGRPMPEVFDINLPVRHPAPTNADIQPLKLVRKVCQGTHRTPETGKVALAHLTVPLGQISLNDYEFKATKDAEAVENDVIKAVQAAQQAQCLAVVFPEYSIPRQMGVRLLEMAARFNIVLIGGFEGTYREGKLVDEVFVAIPGEPKLYHQYKQSPSLEEPTPVGFFHDGSLHLFCSSPIGDFCVVVCSDFLETATQDAWTLAGPLPDIIFVVARNPYPDLYQSFAITDSFRLYCSVAVSNVLDAKDPALTSSKGSFVVSPLRDKPVDEGVDVAVNGTFLRKVTVHDIRFASIRARVRGKPDQGFFAVPRSAKRA